MDQLSADGASASSGSASKPKTNAPQAASNVAVTTSTEPTPPRIIAVGGGKGGAGKTVFTANLAVQLAQSGRKVILLDADLGGANAHTVLGIAPPLVTLSDFVQKRAELPDIAVQTPFANLRLIAGALDDVSAANPAYQQKMRLLRHLAKLDCDDLLIDLGAGTSYNIVDFFLVADEPIVVVQPEPTSVENAYRFLKAAFIRRLRAVQRVFGLRDLLDVAMHQRNELGIHTPADLMRAISAHDPEVGAAVQQLMTSFSPRLVVNQVMQVPGSVDHLVARDMSSACRRFFGIPLRELGMVPSSDGVRLAVRQRQPVTVMAPDDIASQALRDIALRLQASTSDAAQAGRAA